MKLSIKTLILFFLILLFNNVPGNAQYLKKRLTTDFMLGANFVHVSGIESPSDLKFGLNIGAFVNYKILRNIHIQSGFIITKKGYKTHNSTTDYNETDNIKTITDRWFEVTANYIQVPLNLGYELYFTKKMAFNINGGVYVAYGYGNKGKSTENVLLTTYVPNTPSASVQNEVKNENTFSQTVWKRPDYGLNANVGFVYDIYMINLGYSHGLYNVSQDNTKDIENRVYSLSFGFRF